MDTLLKDLRFGARSLLRQRGFTSVVVITLALGIGAGSDLQRPLALGEVWPPPFPIELPVLVLREARCLGGKMR